MLTWAIDHASREAMERWDMKIVIDLHLHGQLAIPGRRDMPVEVDAGETLLEILSNNSVAEGVYSILQLNGRLVDSQVVLEDGDVVDVYPPIGGG